MVCSSIQKQPTFLLRWAHKITQSAKQVTNTKKGIKCDAHKDPSSQARTACGACANPGFFSSLARLCSRQSIWLRLACCIHLAISAEQILHQSCMSIAKVFYSTTPRVGLSYIGCKRKNGDSDVQHSYRLFTTKQELTPSTK